MPHLRIIIPNTRTHTHTHPYVIKANQIFQVLTEFGDEGMASGVEQVFIQLAEGRIYINVFSWPNFLRPFSTRSSTGSLLSLAP